MKRCAACGQENDDWRPFCTRCGASYAGPAAEPVLAPASPGAPSAPPAPLPPAPPGIAGSSGAPGSTPRRPSSTVIAVAAVVAVVVAVGAFVGLSTVSSGGHKASAPTTTFPALWDNRVSGLVQFVEKERKLDFTHPVKVVFLSKAEFTKRVTSSDTALTSEERRYYQHELESLRALGMVEGKVDLFARLNQLSGASILAFYDDEKKQIVIPSGTLDIEERVTLAHELTHTLDDEHFNLTEMRKKGEEHDTDAVRALIEGNAVWVQNRYIAKLSDADRRAYARTQLTAIKPDDVKGVPEVFHALFGWPYDFGPQLIAILQDQGGQARVDKAFRSPPLDQEQVLDPMTYLDGDQPGPISAPLLPRGAKKLETYKEFGMLTWYLVLSEHIDAHVALKAAVGWGADAYTVATEGGRTCVEVHYRGETRHDNAEMLGALRQWIAALPKGMASVKANKDDTLSLHSCDPGATAKVVTDRSVDAYQLLAFRSGIIQGFVHGGGTPAVATCMADAIAARTSISALLEGKTPAVLDNAAGIAALVAECRTTSGTVVGPGQIDD